MKYFFALLLLPALSFAASESFDNYTVHYQAVNSTFLNAEVAEQYGITRGDRRGFLNISVIQTVNGGVQQAVPATVSGGKRNLLGQTGDISFREIREASAVYYIGEFEYSNAEMVRFAINVQPEGSNETFEIRWETRMYNN